MIPSDLNFNNFRSGFVALIGRPNVGKSTWLNQVIGSKIAITSPVAQTTRNRLKAILTNSKAQLIFVDSPGIHKPHHLLGERLVNSSKKLICNVDIVMLILDASCLPGRGDMFIINLLRERNIPVIVALNKWDLVKESEQNKRFNSYKSFVGNANWEIFCCSSISGEGCCELVDFLSGELPRGPKLYPENILSDQSENMLYSELIREQVLLHTREEIPHSVAVTIDRIEETPSKKNKMANNLKTAILATVHVERKSQKGILIGKGGSMLKKIGQESRMQIQTLINGNVYLELFVKVVPDWRSKSSRLNEFGYEGS